MPGPAPASIGQLPGEKIAACWPVLCNGNSSNEYFQFGPVYAFTENGVQAFRVSNFHVWYTLDGNGHIDLKSAYMRDQRGVADDAPPPWRHRACLPDGPPGQNRSGDGQYDVVNHGILSLPKDMCFGFTGAAPETAATFYYFTNVNLTPATSTVPPSIADSSN